MHHSLLLILFGTYSILVEGHAASVFWDDEKRAAQEQEEELIPLSAARAETIKSELVDRGISAERIMTAGIGSANPIVPHGDEANRWKNRRIEIVFEK